MHIYTVPVVADLIGLPYTTAVDWIKRGILAPVHTANGPGTRAYFDFRGVVEAGIAAWEREQGISLNLIKQGLDDMRNPSRRDLYWPEGEPFPVAAVWIVGRTGNLFIRDLAIELWERLEQMTDNEATNG